MKQDRFLIAILVVIVLLIGATLGVFFLRQDIITYEGGNTPEAVVHDYILAVLKKDYTKAYTYLADLKDKPTYEFFQTAFATGELQPQNVEFKTGSTQITGDNATVEINMNFQAGGPFASGYQNAGQAVLVQQNGAWKISNIPQGNVWGWNWYQPQMKP